MICYINKSKVKNYIKNLKKELNKRKNIKTKFIKYLNDF